MENTESIENLLINAAKLGYSLKKNKLGNKYDYTQINGMDVLVCERLGYTGRVIDIFMEEGYSSIYFNPGKTIDTNNVSCYETVSRVDDNSIKKYTISRTPINRIDIKTADSTFSTIAFPVVKERAHYAFESFEPTGCDALQYSEVTGLPIIYDVSSLKYIYRFLNKPVDESTSIHEPPFLVMFQRKFNQKKDKSYKKTQLVKLLYLDKKSFLAGDKPTIIMFSHVAGRYNSKGVFRRQRNGRYVDNGSYTVLKGRPHFVSYPFDRVMELAGDMVQPLGDDLVTGINGGLGAIIPKEYMDLSVSLINRTMSEDPNGGEIEDTEPEIV